MSFQSSLQFPLRTIPAVVALAFTLPAAAANPSEQEPLSVVVTATRFADADPRIAANITVISRDDIRNSPARDIPGLLKSRAGIEVRALYGSLGVDASIDLRGFGDAAVSNTLILLDGQRLNAVDSAPISWSSVPLASVQRIEIIRGSGTVLYGDRASGGVINIITDKSGRNQASVEASVGSNDSRGLDAQFSGSVGDAYYRVAAHHAATDGWRQNGWAEQTAASGRVGLRFNAGEGFADYAVYRDASGMPGYSRQADFDNRPQYSRSPRDSQWREGYRLRPGFSLDLGQNLRLEAEVTGEGENFHTRSDNGAVVNRSTRERDSWSFTPRLSWRHGLGALKSETVVGFDHYDGLINVHGNNSPIQGAHQSSKAFYLQNQTELLKNLTLTVGARDQQMQQGAHQAAYAPWFSPAMRGDTERSRTAWDAGLAYSGNAWRVYGKLGTTFRFANTDELFAYDPNTFAPVFAGALRPQHGTIREVGGSFKLGSVNTRISAFRMDLTDEIGYNGNLFTNVNFDPTRRQGGEAEIDWQIVRTLSARLAYSYTDATFRSGAYVGKQMPMVAPHKGSVQLTWDTGTLGRYSVLTNVVGERRYSGDFANVKKALAGYTTVDLQAAWNIKPWTMTLALLNAFDKRYSPFAGYSNSISDYYYYPADGRSLRLTARYDFK